MSKTFSLIALLIITSIFFVTSRTISGIAQTENRAGLVIHFDENRTETFCISFDTDTITGYELLQKSNHVIISSFEAQGAAICKIDTIGCPSSDCFCQSPPDYWSYWHLDNENWTYSSQGSSGYEVHDGDVDGWAWGSGQPPPTLSYDQICSGATETPTPTLSKTSSPTQPLSNTATPTSSATPTGQNNPYPPPAAQPSIPVISTQFPTQPFLPLTPTLGSSQSPVINQPSINSTPMNPRLIFPAAYSTFVAFEPTSTPIRQVDSSTFADTLSNESNPNTQELDKNGFSLPLNYFIFGILAVSLLLVAIIKSFLLRS